MTMNQETREQKLSRFIARCWSDAAFKARLLADPAAVLREEGVEVPAGIQLRVLEDTAQEVHLVIPVRPAELSDEALDNVAGGGGIFGDLIFRGPLFPLPMPGFPFPFR